VLGEGRRPSREIILHMFPTSLMDSMGAQRCAAGGHFPPLLFLARRSSTAGAAGKPVLDFCGSLTQVMFKFGGDHHEVCPPSAWAPPSRLTVRAPGASNPCLALGKTDPDALHRAGYFRGGLSWAR